MPDSTFVEPFTGPSNFALLPGGINQAVTSRRYDTVIMLLVDGLGWRFCEKFQDVPFLRQASAAGKLEKYASQFPSTTAAHLTTIHTGQPVGEHGVFEWNYYEPLLDAIISPLLFSFAGTYARDTLKPAGIRPSRLLPTRNLYRLFSGQNLTSVIFQHREYTPSTYSDVLFAGAQAHGYKTLPEALVNLGETLEAPAPPAYIFIYYDRVDGICHEYGPTSPQAEAEILSTLSMLEQVLLPVLLHTRRKLLFHMTADHGQSETDPATTVYLNREPRFEGVEAFLRTNRAGHLLVPGGSCRDFFLYIKPGMVEEAHQFLAARLEGQAQVRRIEDMLAAGSFGPIISPKFRARLGDLVILPYRGESVWWYEKDRFEQRYYGHHGGLTPQEMEIPLLTWEL